MVNGYEICLGVGSEWGLPVLDVMTILKETGFDGFFVKWDKNTNIKEIKTHAQVLGLKFQSIHAPYYNVADMWDGNEKTEEAIKELLACVEDCYQNNVPIMVSHAIIGFDKHSPNEIGVNSFKVVVERAKELGVKVAFENTEGEEYLHLLMDSFKDYDNVGFCWDTGHEMCYSLCKDLLALYGERLLSTHINDNLGATDPQNIFWTDDLHLLPFDGIANWQGITDRLKAYGYCGELTFEMCKSSKPNRHENDRYDAMSVEEYVKEIYERATKVAELM